MQIVQTRLCPITVPLNFACVENNRVSVLFTIQITELTFVKFCTGGFFSHGMQQCVMLLAVFVPLKTL